MARIVMLLTNPHLPDPRVQKEAAWLVAEGHEVEVFALDRLNTRRDTPVEDIDGVTIRRFFTSPEWVDFEAGRTELLTRILNRIPFCWHFETLRHLLRFKRAARTALEEDARRGQSADFLHGHDLSGVWLACGMRQKVPVIFDMHEEYLKATPKKARFAFLVRPFLHRMQNRSSGIIYIHPAQIEDVAPRNRDKLVYVPNYPLRRTVDFGDTARAPGSRPEQPETRAETKAGQPEAKAETKTGQPEAKAETRPALKVPDEQPRLRLSYSGSVNPDTYEIHRNFLEAARGLAIDITISGRILPGKGAEHFEDMASLNPNLRLYGAYRFDEDVMRNYEETDLCYFAYNYREMAYRWNAPNKFYEALATCTPFIVEHRTAMAELATSEQVGFPVDTFDAAAIRALLQRLLADPSLIAAARARMREKRFYAEYVWEKIAPNLRVLYG